MLDRVVEQVPQDAFHAAPVHFGHTRPWRKPEFDPRPPPRSQLLRVRRRPPDQVAHIRRLSVQGRHVGVVPADLQQVRQELLEPFKLALQQLGRTRSGRIELVLGLEKHVGSDPDGAQRSAQLMRHVRDELPLDLGQFFQFPELVLQAGGHLVEGGRQRRQVVGPPRGHALIQLSCRQPARRLCRLPDGDHHPAGDQRNDDGQQQYKCDPSTDQRGLDEPERLVSVLPEPLLVPEESERDGYVPNVVYSCGALPHGPRRAPRARRKCGCQSEILQRVP